MDHLRNGLETNGVLELAIKHPDLFKELLTYSERYDQVTAEAFINITNFSNMSADEAVTFCAVLKSMPQEDIQGYTILCIRKPGFGRLRSESNFNKDLG